jgi:phenylacetate-coenzyme A ligase PaaK-like adenylate-forming protein
MTTVTDTVRTLAEPWLGTDPDVWTRRVVRRHFDPVGGSPYWLRRRPFLGFDPLDVTEYRQLAEFGPFPLDALRGLDPVELVPARAPRPLSGRIWESGGTTGKPFRVLYTDAMSEHHSAWRRFGLDLTGFARGRTWLYACPAGPHVVGCGADQIARLHDATVYTMDFDPRWTKRLIRRSRLAAMNAHVDHIIEQMADILETGRVQYLETTPALLQVLVNRRPELVARLDGVGLGGTQLTPAMYREVAAALGDGVIGTTYGNTFGCAIGLPAERGGDVLPYLPGYPQVTIAVVDPEDSRRIVGYGQTGRVRLTVLHEDLFLPNILERDQAIRYDPGEAWPCDGVANVSPLRIAPGGPEGLF